MSFGNLYHLNAEEEPEDPEYPKDPNYKKMLGPRGVLRCTAATRTTKQYKVRLVHRQKKIEDTGPLNLKRMETIDEV